MKWYNADEIPTKDIELIVQCSGTDGNVSYEHAIICGCYYEDGKFYMNSGLYEPNITIEKWTYIPSPKDDDFKKGYLAAVEEMTEKNSQVIEMLKIAMEDENENKQIHNGLAIYRVVELWTRNHIHDYLEIMKSKAE